MNRRIALEVRHGAADVRLTRAGKMNALDAGMFKTLLAAGEGDHRAAALGIRSGTDKLRNP